MASSSDLEEDISSDEDWKEKEEAFGKEILAKRKQINEKRNFIINENDRFSMLKK